MFKRITIVALAAFSLAVPAAQAAPEAPHGRYEMHIRVVRDHNVGDRYVGQRLTRTLRVRSEGHGRRRVAIENRFGTFVYHRLTLHGKWWIETETYVRPTIRGGETDWSRTLRWYGKLKFRVLENGNLAGTFRSTSADHYYQESWIFTAEPFTLDG